jgi:uncharacterized protein DUF885
MSLFRAARIAATLASAILLAACQSNPKPPSVAAATAADSTQDWDRTSSNFLEWYFKAQPDVAVYAGRHEFDGQLPDWSAAGLQAQIEHLHAERERIRGFPAEGLDARRRFDRLVLLGKIEGDLFWLESAKWPWRSPSFYGGIDPNPYVAREYAPLAQRLQAYTKYARAVPAAAEQIRHNLRTPLPRTYIQNGHMRFGGLARFYENEVPAIFAAVDDARLQTEFREANASAVKAMRELDAWLTAQEASATDDFALGPDRFQEMLRATEGVAVPLARLKQIGEDDLQRNLQALREACAAYDPGGTVQQCAQKVEAHKPSRSPIEEATLQLADLKAFVQVHDVVSIPGPEQALVQEAPAYRRWNAAYINIPGPYEKNLPSVYRIAPPDPKWTKEEQEAYIPAQADLLFISVHEVWPGHFLQRLHSSRAASRIEQVFPSYAFSEGWAHYTEEMMWEVGLGNGDPETHIGQLTNALLRDVRYLSAIGLHTGGMTVAQSEAMFRELAFQDPGNARQQAARGTFDPAYGNYTLGKLMIRKLRDDWTASRGGRMAWKGFHDELLSHGSPPIPLVREAMLGNQSAPL